MTGAESIFADQGLMGAIILVLLTVCGALWRRLTIVQDARLEDVKSHASELSTVAREVSHSMDNLRVILEVKRNV